MYMVVEDPFRIASVSVEQSEPLSIYGLMEQVIKKRTPLKLTYNAYDTIYEYLKYFENSFAF